MEFFATEGMGSGHFKGLKRLTVSGESDESDGPDGSDGPAGARVGFVLLSGFMPWFASIRRTCGGSGWFRALLRVSEQNGQNGPRVNKTLKRAGYASLCLSNLDPGHFLRCCG